MSLASERGLPLLVHLVGILLVLVGAFMLPAWLIALWDGSADRSGLQVSALGTMALGALLFFSTRRSVQRIALGHREGFLVVAVGWLVASLAGALPFYLYALLSPDEICAGRALFEAGSLPRLPVGGEFCAFTDAVFESISGFTTTGASILTGGLWDGPGSMMSDGRAGLPRGILLWRSTTHLLGGMGIIVLGVAILPLLGVGGMQLFRAEVPGPTTDKLAPRISETARLLWKVYLALTAAQVVLLMLGGVDWFSAINHAMSTMGTGGFSLYATSVGAFDSGYVEWVITLFMFVAGANFTLHFLAWSGRPKSYLSDPEFRLYTLIVVACSVVVASALLMSARVTGVGEAARQAAFAVVTIMTTTGFASADFETWVTIPLALLPLLGLMFVGGMSGSTGGGVKVIRHLLLVQHWIRELFMLVHPRAVRPVRVAGRPIPEDVMRAVSSFVGAYLALFALGALVFVLDGHDLVTALTASISALGNIGPGLGAIGPLDNWSVLSQPAKCFACLLMLLGRLEIYTLLVLLTPAFWRR